MGMVTQMKDTIWVNYDHMHYDNDNQSQGVHIKYIYIWLIVTRSGFRLVHLNIITINMH